MNYILSIWILSGIITYYLTIFTIDKIGFKETFPNSKYKDSPIIDTLVGKYTGKISTMGHLIFLLTGLLGGLLGLLQMLWFLSFRK